MNYEKCSCCNKKSHLLFKCKCEKMYCTSHILPEKHKCTNMKKHSEESFKINKDTLLKNKIIVQKIEPI